MKKHHVIAAIAILSFIVAIYDTSAGIYVALLANVFSNYVVVSRQTEVKIKKVTKKEFDKKVAPTKRQHPFYTTEFYD